MPMTVTPTTTGRRRLLAGVIFTLMLLAETWYAGAVLRPPQADSTGGGAWESLEALAPNSVDVVFYGSSHAYTAVDPAVIWREAGIPTFVHGGPTQRLQVTEYYIRETLRTQRPRVIALEMVSSSYTPRTFKAHFQHYNVSQMPLSANKLAASWLATPPDMRINILFDVWAYHGRWSEIRLDDFKLAEKNAERTYLKGYHPNSKMQSVEATPYVRPPTDNPLANAGVDYNREALRRIAEVCDEHDVELLLFLAPTGPPSAYTHYMMSAAHEMEKHHDNVTVLDLSEKGAVPGLSFKTDFRDGGHLNWVGAEKTSRVLARYLAEHYSLPDRRSEPGRAVWDEDAEARDQYIRELGAPRLVPPEDE